MEKPKAIGQYGFLSTEDAINNHNKIDDSRYVARRVVSSLQVNLFHDVGQLC